LIPQFYSINRIYYKNLEETKVILIDFPLERSEYDWLRDSLNKF